MMCRTLNSHFFVVAFRLLLILGLVAIPSTGWATGQASPLLTQRSAANSVFLSPSWLRVGPSAQSYHLRQALAGRSLQIDQTLGVEEALVTASVMETMEEEKGVNSQVMYVVWLMLR